MTVDEVFLKSVGHDLRGELATMVTAVHYLLRYEAELGPVARQMLDRTNGAGQRMKRLLDEFDDAAWIDGGDRSAMTVEPCRAHLVINGALDRLSQAVQSREVAIDLHVPSDLPPFNADARLSGIAIEYVLDFSSARSRKKRVCVTGAAHGERTVVSIADEGGPIPEDARRRILDPFVEKKLVPRPEEGQRKREGLGLGLAIARGILTLHGGELVAENAKDGHGIIFHVMWSHAGPEAARKSPAGGEVEKVG